MSHNDPHHAVPGGQQPRDSGQINTQTRALRHPREMTTQTSGLHRPRVALTLWFPTTQNVNHWSDAIFDRSSTPCNNRIKVKWKQMHKSTFVNPLTILTLCSPIPHYLSLSLTVLFIIKIHSDNNAQTEYFNPFISINPLTSARFFKPF